MAELVIDLDLAQWEIKLEWRSWQLQKPALVHMHEQHGFARVRKHKNTVSCVRCHRMPPKEMLDAAKLCGVKF